MIKIKQLDKNITLRYITALSLIAILSSIAFYSLQSALINTSSTGYIVNISGKQRMLSQHIALDVYRIYAAHNKVSDDFNKNSVLPDQILKQHTQEMLQANTILTTGHLPDQTVISLSATIHNMYFGEMNLAQRVKNYIVTAEQLLEPNSNLSPGKIIQIIDAQSEPLLRDLNKVVQQYQLEGEQKLEQIQTIETITWVATIMTLLLEVIFIFQPMVQKISSLSTDNAHVLTNLENLVESRTHDLENANNKLKLLASSDPLTGLRNRLNLETDIEKAIEHYQSHHAPYAVIMFDIDWFKQVNDNYGHDIGDFVLTQLANILKSAVREGDKIYRAGGEEFVILLNRIDYDDSVNFAEKIRILIQQHEFLTNNISLSKTVSGGLFHSSISEVTEVAGVLKLMVHHESAYMG